jgi:hypothetical protein
MAALVMAAPAVLVVLAAQVGPVVSALLAA